MNSFRKVKKEHQYRDPGGKIEGMERWFSFPIKQCSRSIKHGKHCNNHFRFVVTGILPLCYSHLYILCSLKLCTRVVVSKTLYFRLNRGKYCPFSVTFSRPAVAMMLKQGRLRMRCTQLLFV